MQEDINARNEASWKLLRQFQKEHTTPQELKDYAKPFITIVKGTKTIVCTMFDFEKRRWFTTITFSLKRERLPWSTLDYGEGPRSRHYRTVRMIRECPDMEFHTISDEEVKEKIMPLLFPPDLFPEGETDDQAD
jgi:hypothetical protein